METVRNRCPGCRRVSCDGCGIYQKKTAPGGGEIYLNKLNTNKQIREEFPEGFEMEPGEGIGISFDVGTTTLAGMLWDLKGGILLGAETAANPQAIFGADVISRIRAVDEEEALKKMQSLLVEKLDGMAESLAGKCAQASVGQSPPQSAGERKAAEALAGKAKQPYSEAAIRRAVFVGNTAMCEILLGIKPEGLSGAPFVPDYEKTVAIKGRRLGFRFLENTDIIVLPPIGGYVGSDALAVYGCVSRQEPGGRILAVDIGTNGEILLQCGEENGNRIGYACSAAAGPALEGGAVSQGMRAAEGAIDRVSISGSFPMQDIVCHVLGETPPAGICGSGLVDALAALLKTGVLDDTGYMRSPGEARLAGVPGRICRRIRAGAAGWKFLLTEEAHPVYLTAEDVRQLQLAVSALRSGMEILLKKAGFRAKELDRIYLAGAFGCYIRKESALSAGLLPKVSEEKVVQAGNLAGVGSAMALLSRPALERMERECGKLAHVELAEEEEFKEKFLKHLNFNC